MMHIAGLSITGGRSRSISLLYPGAMSTMRAKGPDIPRSRPPGQDAALRTYLQASSRWHFCFLSKCRECQVFISHAYVPRYEQEHNLGTKQRGSERGTTCKQNIPAFDDFT
ncbi:hypothetical protein NDU88_004585 [Pleurodeles waltl]|uniref:Uncharacterized protein n=1 Tax=Pleurodeles waltl TaxID=8319 RepID=A0AAV7NJW4_PLEWA|nr:hypothetical protein NDU88_004585 [Pleurodeles waltl]